MVKIRLARGGSRKSPFYYIVVTDSRNPRDGRFIERIGFFNPINLKLNKKLYFNESRMRFWISKGAKLSDRVFLLMKKSKNLLI